MPVHLRPILGLLLVLLLAGLSVTTTPVVAMATCSINGGFAKLRERIPDKVGDCVENERVDPVTGNTDQHTTLGLLTWRKADGLLSFTDGTTTWFLRQTELLQRPNSAPPFPWEAVVIPPAAPPAGGSQLWAETFDDPSSAFCRSRASAQWGSQCIDGEYRVTRSEQTSSAWLMTPLGTYANAGLAVDARLVGGVEQRFIALVCRNQGRGQGGGYHFTIQPALGRAALHRAPLAPATEWIPLADWQVVPALHRGQEVNRLELICSGSTISATVNGSPAFSVQDQTYRDGSMLLRTEAWIDGVAVDARFDNAVITER